MAKKTSEPEKSSKGTVRGKREVAAAEFKLKAVVTKAVTVKHHDAPPPFEKRQSIHRRRLLPRVKEGKERAFHSTTREIALTLQRALPVGRRASTDEITLVTNTELTQPGQQQLASSVGEPSVAANGDVVLYTGNWYAARSVDGGKTFQYIDPFTSFPDPANLGFCCDQVVNYIASIDTFVWLLQYGPKSGPDQDNLQRLAFAKTADVQTGKWRLFDITTANVGLAGMFLDFPDLAVGANSLYVTSNVFTAQGQGAGAIVVRLPIADIDSGSPTAQTFPSTDLNSFRVAQNCGTTAYFASHVDTSTMRVFAWDEGQAAPTPTDVGVARWIDGRGYQSRTPDQQRWLDRIDSRITGAAMAGSELWFAWSVDAGSNKRPNAFVQIARIDATNLTLLENINVFDPNAATAYGALSSNDNGEVGISYMIGGSQQFPSHMIGILTGTRKDLLAGAGERGTADGQWGDYLTVRPQFPNRKLFVATGYTMKGAGDGSNRDATPRYVVFGRSSDTGAQPVPVPEPIPPQPPTPPPTPPVPPGPLPPTPVDDGEPITDVNSLPIVPPDVAAKVKAAAGFTGTPGTAQMPIEALAAAPPAADKPGVERWPVKTGQDPDRAKVGKNVVNDVDLGAGIVPATIEELISLPRPQGLMPATSDPPAFKDVRANITEMTIWQIEATIIALKHEADGDYHLVLQGTSGQEMVGEIPTPTTVFVGDSPWIDNIGQARQQVDDKLVKHLSPQAFALAGKKLLPHGAMSFTPQEAVPATVQFTTPKEGSKAVQPLFSTQITPTQARITGVGFFDRAHGATGAAPNVIELHPVLKVEWL